MAYEKVRVTRLSERTDKETGEVTHYVEFERLESSKFKIEKFMELRPDFESLLGREVLVPIRAGAIDGRTFWMLEGDGIPIPVPSRSPLAAVKDSQLARQEESLSPQPQVTAVRSPIPAVMSGGAK